MYTIFFYFVYRKILDIQNSPVNIDVVVLRVVEGLDVIFVGVDDFVLVRSEPLPLVKTSSYLAFVFEFVFISNLADFFTSRWYSRVS